MYVCAHLYLCVCMCEHVYNNIASLCARMYIVLIYACANKMRMISIWLYICCQVPVEIFLLLSKYFNTCRRVPHSLGDSWK